MTAIIPVNTSSASEKHDLKTMYFDYIRELLPYEHDDRCGISEEESFLLQLAPGEKHLRIPENGKRVGFKFYGLIATVSLIGRSCSSTLFRVNAARASEQWR